MSKPKRQGRDELSGVGCRVGRGIKITIRITIKIKKDGEFFAEEGVDLGLAVGLVTRAALAEEAEDLVGFQVNAFDLVIVTATLDG